MQCTAGALLSRSKRSRSSAGVPRNFPELYRPGTAAFSSRVRGQHVQLSIPEGVSGVELRDDFAPLACKRV